MNQYVNKRFSNQYKATIGADLYVLFAHDDIQPSLKPFPINQLDKRGLGRRQTSDDAGMYTRLDLPASLLYGLCLFSSGILRAKNAFNHLELHSTVELIVAFSFMM